MNEIFFKFGINLIVVILSAKKNCIDVHVP